MAAVSANFLFLPLALSSLLKTAAASSFWSILLPCSVMARSRP